MTHLSTLKNKLKSATKITLKTQKGFFSFTPIIIQEHIAGVEVDNLGSSKFIPIDVFVAVISLLELSPGKFAINGKAMDHKLGDLELPFNSIEGHVAKIVYGRKNGDSVFRRITPIVKILVWAGVCEITRGVGGVQGGLRLIS